MSIVDFKEAQTISQGLNFRAMIMAAMMKGDSQNREKLRAAFPEIFEELKRRQAVAGGYLDDHERGIYEKESTWDPETLHDALLIADIDVPVDVIRSWSYEDHQLVIEYLGSAICSVDRPAVLEPYA